MSTSSSKRLLSEKKAFWEAEYQQRKQYASYFHFLDSLSLNRFHSKKNKNRYDDVAKKLEMEINAIPDEVLKHIYDDLVLQHRLETNFNHPSSGYSQTKFEIIAMKNIMKILEENPERFRNVVLLPNTTQNKIPIGSHVLDILLLGLSRRGTSATIIEVDDEETHRKKYRKDNYAYDEMNKLKIQVLPITNDLAQDIDFLRGLLYQLEPHETKDQILKGERVLRRIWCYTIASLMPLHRFSISLRTYGIKMNLEKILSHVAMEPNCPRKIKSEARRVLG